MAFNVFLSICFLRFSKFFKVFSRWYQVFLFKNVQIALFLLPYVRTLDGFFLLPLNINKKMLEVAMSVVEAIGKGNERGCWNRPAECSRHYELISPFEKLFVSLVGDFLRKNFVVFSDDTEEIHKFCLGIFFKS